MKSANPAIPSLPCLVRTRVNSASASVTVASQVPSIGKEFESSELQPRLIMRKRLKNVSNIQTIISKILLEDLEQYIFLQT